MWQALQAAKSEAVHYRRTIAVLLVRRAVALFASHDVGGRDVRAGHRRTREAGVGRVGIQHVFLGLERVVGDVAVGLPAAPVSGSNSRRRRAVVVASPPVPPSRRDVPGCGIGNSSAAPVK